MKLKPIYRIIFLSAFFFVGVFAQFSEITVTIDTRMLRGSTEDYLVKSLKNQIESYYITSLFSPEAMDLDISIDIQIVLESITTSGNQKLINGQALFSNRKDQQYFARGFEFPYDEGISMNYSTLFDPLSSLFDYYAWLFIAGELDTYHKFGGNLYYSRAIDLSVSGQSSNYSRGWENREKRVQEIKDNLELRRAKFYFFQAYDIAGAAKVKASDILEPLQLFYTNLERSIYGNGVDKYTEPFLKIYSNDIATMLKATRMTDELQAMIELDPKNKDVYESVLKEKK